MPRPERLTPKVNEVIVSNLGNVHTGTHKTADAEFRKYVKLSKAGPGRVGGESVTWLKDGEIYREHIGSLHQESSPDDAATDSLP